MSTQPFISVYFQGRFMSTQRVLQNSNVMHKKKVFFCSFWNFFISFRKLVFFSLLQRFVAV